MKANEFFKKHGWNDTKVMIESPFGLGEYEYLWDDLKRLIESHELVESHGGLYQARKVAHKNCFEYPVHLLQAIADVESCQ